MLDVTGAEIRIPAKPSEVFLKAIQALAIADPDMPGTEFKEYAEAWRQICHLEELYAAAERKMAPTLVGFMISSRTAIRFTPDTTSSIVFMGGRRMAHSMPRVSVNPVNCVRTS